MIRVSNVKVMGMPDGNVIVQNEDKPEYGTITFEQQLFVNNKGFWNLKHRIAYTAGKMNELHMLAEQLEMYPGMDMPGNICVLESFDPFYSGQPPKCNPTTGMAVLVNGKPVYMKTHYDETGEMKDRYLEGTITIGNKVMEPKVIVTISTSPESSTI